MDSGIGYRKRTHPERGALLGQPRGYQIWRMQCHLLGVSVGFLPCWPAFSRICPLWGCLGCSSVLRAGAPMSPRPHGGHLWVHGRVEEHHPGASSWHEASPVSEVLSWAPRSCACRWGGMLPAAPPGCAPVPTVSTFARSSPVRSAAASCLICDPHWSQDLFCSTAA